MNLKLADISKWQYPIKPDVMASKLHGVFMRCQYGKYEDGYFRTFRNQLEGKLLWTPYLFWVADISYQDHIKTFKELCGSNNNGAWAFEGQFGAWMDMEKFTRPDGMSISAITKAWLDFTKAFYEILGLYIGVYSNLWWDSNMGNVTKDQIINHDLWTANWVGEFTEPIKPKPWRDYNIPWVFHQYSASGNKLGNEYGVFSKDIDLDRFNGTIAQFEKRYHVKVHDLPPVPEPTLPKEVVVGANYVALRYMPSEINNKPLGYAYPASVWRPDGMTMDDKGRYWYWFGKDRQIYMASWLTKPL